MYEQAVERKKFMSNEILQMENEFNIMVFDQFYTDIHPVEKEEDIIMKS